PAFDAVSRSLLQQPVNNLMQGAGTALQQQVPADKREATAKAIEADIKKFVDDTTPMMRERAVKLAPSTIGAILEERFSEEELRQLMVWVESPLSQKFAQFGVDAPRALAEKLVADTRPTVEPRLKTLEQGIIKRLNDAGAKIGKPSSPATAPATPAAPTKK
ncbi:MAG TPA: hypothetical protein VJN44_11105, partial [Roseateles sp.]|nr:hypothetical protein [Roseateles sp.]